MKFQNQFPVSLYPMLATVTTIVTAFSFIYYGTMCLFSKWMVLEFQRYRLSEFQRKITGLLQLAGSIGLLTGLKLPLVGLLAASGLSVLMLLGFLTRLKIRDTLIQSLPSFIFMLINGYLAYAFSQQWTNGISS